MPEDAYMRNLAEQNEKLKDTLIAAREQIVALKEELDKLAQPPAGYGVYLGSYPDGTLDVFTSGKKFRVNLSSEIESSDLQRGQEVLLNDTLSVIEVMPYDRTGSMFTLVELLGEDRAIVSTESGESAVVLLSDRLLDKLPKPGDSLLVEPKSGYAFEIIPKSEVEQLLLEEVPDIEYSDIGGLASQIEAIRDAVELPFLHADLFKEHKLSAPKGVLLYGPPGTGKTLIAKAVANSLAKKVNAGQGEAKSYFISIAGPELLSKWVGESERQIRLVFQRAREKASEGMPVIVFFDEMESLFRTRGSGISSDVESTIVPTILAELDGLEGLRNVIVIGATNRAEMVDPAVLRPGRLDVKIRVERPDESGSADIFSKYLTPDLPLHEDDLKVNGKDPQKTIEAMIRSVVERMYSKVDDNEFLEVTYEGGSKEILYFKDFNSGAMINGIVNRAKKAAVKDFLDSGERGIRASHLLAAVSEEFRENEDLPSTASPDDWARVSGLKGEKIVYIRSLVSKRTEEPVQPVENTFGLGQYL